MKVTGTLNVKFQFVDEFKKLVLVVTAGNGPSLLGQNWLNHINLNPKKSFALGPARLGSLYMFMQRHKELFAQGLGTVEPYKVPLQDRQEAKPRFLKPQPVLLTIRDVVEKESDQLEQQGIL